VPGELRGTSAPALLTIEQVAAQLQVHPRTVRRAIAAGGLRACRLPGRGARGIVRVRPADLDAWLEERSAAPAPPLPAVPLAPVAAAARSRAPHRARGHLTVTGEMGRAS
jgi:excisionase family DNA binding protein